jgi:hypothetical protein
MLQFEVHDPKGIARDGAVRAHLLGRDDQPIAGSVSVSGNRILCKPVEPVAAALCLEYDAAPIGRLMLQTCLLPARVEPYRLNLELARHRIKQYIAKGEEWLLFDPTSGGDSFKIWERARTLFVHAMNERDPAVAETKARESLVAGLEASERLAVMHAEAGLQRRYAVRPASSTLVGVRIDPRDDPAAVGGLAREFDVMAIDLPWSVIEPAPGQYDFSAVDRWMALAAQSRRPIVAGPLLRFDDAWLPSWMQRFKGDYKGIVDRSYAFMEQVVHRYRAVATLWNLCSGLHRNAWHPFSDAERIDLTRRAALLVRQSRRGARTLVELGDPFGESWGASNGSSTAWQFLERLLQEGVHLDAVGMQLCIGGPDGSVRDMMQISAMLDRFMGYECKVMLSALGAPSASVGGGWWRKPWTSAVQDAWATSVATIALSKPFVETLVWERLSESATDPRGSCAMIDAARQPRPVARKLLSIRNRLRKPLQAPAAPARDEKDPSDTTATGAAAV